MAFIIDATARILIFIRKIMYRRFWKLNDLCTLYCRETIISQRMRGWSLFFRFFFPITIDLTEKGKRAKRIVGRVRIVWNPFAINHPEVEMYTRVRTNTRLLVNITWNTRCVCVFYYWQLPIAYPFFFQTAKLSNELSPALNDHFNLQSWCTSYFLFIELSLFIFINAYLS